MTESKPNRLGISVKDDGATFTAGSLLTSLGGWWGIVESIAPTLLYISIFTITSNVLYAAIPAGAASLGFLIRQFVVKKSLGSAIAGAISVVIAIALPLREGGHASDYFTVGLLTNAAYLVAISISIVVRFPVVGLLVSGIMSSGLGWRKDKSQLRRFDAATLLWVFLFGFRLVVEAPLYFASQLQMLGVVKLILGVPFYAIVVWLTWLIVRPLIRARH